MVYLDATDELLRDRVMNLPEKVVQEHNYEQDHFLGRLSKYRENNAENDNVLQYFDEIDILPLHISNTLVIIYNLFLILQIFVFSFILFASRHCHNPWDE